LTSLTIATDTTVGAYLADGNGRPLYIFTKDTGTTSTCDAACQQEWTPVVVTGIPTLMTGVSTGLVGTTMTASGATQLTIGGHPVYYHVGDTMSGELTGQGMDNAWFLISPTGSAAR
jgi:predicted lipoprotein with Yx(FWY)xxD motif